MADHDAGPQTGAAPGTLGILAGGGTLPRVLVEACRTAGRESFVIAFKGHAAEQTVAGDVAHKWVRLGAVGRSLAALRAAGVEELVMAGPVRRPSLLELRPDAAAAKYLARGLLRRGDDGLLRGIIGLLEDEGFRVVGPDDVLKPLLAPAGPLGTARPDEGAHADITRGRAVAKALGGADVGQAVVVQEGVVLAVEAAEGTDGMVQRAGTLQRAGPGGVLVKVVKPGQERRADLPTIGPATVATAAAAGLAGIAVEAGGCLVVERDETVAAADAAGLFIFGMADQAG